MRYGYTIIYVPDVAAALEFYANAFGLQQHFLDESGTYGELETGATRIAFSRHDLAETLFAPAYTPLRGDQPPAGIELGLVTDDVSGAYARAIAAGAAPLQEPLIKPWGQTVAYVRDLNGVVIELCSPME